MTLTALNSRGLAEVVLRQRVLDFIAGSVTGSCPGLDQALDHRVAKPIGGCGELVGHGRVGTGPAKPRFTSGF